jgi:hypothetical protein
VEFGTHFHGHTGNVVWRLALESANQPMSLLVDINRLVAETPHQHFRYSLPKMTTKNGNNELNLRDNFG